MYLVDANILVYSTDEDSEHHAAARDWLDERTAGAPRSVGLPWPSLLAFFRLVTNPRIYSPPATAADAWQRIEDWLSRSAAWIPVPGPRHQQVLSGIVRERRPSGNLVPDAHLAALALEHGLTVVSTDTDFARFPGIAWLNPVSATALWRFRRPAIPGATRSARVSRSAAPARRAHTGRLRGCPLPRGIRIRSRTRRPPSSAARWTARRRRHDARHPADRAPMAGLAHLAGHLAPLFS